MNATCRWLLACVGTASLAAMARHAIAQPEGPPPPPPGENAPQPRAADDAAKRDDARRLINERLKRMEEQQRALREGLDMLDRGEPLDAVRSHIRGPAGERLERLRDGGPRGGPDGPGGPRLGGPDRDGPRGPGGPGGPGSEGGPGGPHRGGPEDRRGDRDRFEGPREGRGMGPDGPGPGERSRDADGERHEPIELTPDDRKMIVDMLMTSRPGLGERLGKLREENPQEFDAVIQRAAPHFLRVIEDKRRDPEMFQLRRDQIESEFQARRLARQAGTSPSPEQLEALRTALNRQFDARLKVEEHVVKQMRAQIEKVEKRTKEMQDNRSAFIDKTLKELLERASKDREEPNDAPPSPAPADEPR